MHYLTCNSLWITIKAVYFQFVGCSYNHARNLRLSNLLCQKSFLTHLSVQHILVLNTFVEFASWQHVVIMNLHNESLNVKMILRQSNINAFYLKIIQEMHTQSNCMQYFRARECNLLKIYSLLFVLNSSECEQVIYVTCTISMIKEDTL
jgi:hypothetical protein